METVPDNLAWESFSKPEASDTVQVHDRTADELARNWSSGINRGDSAALAALYQAWFDCLVTTVQASH